ncbi:MAG: hypothetical protein JWN98_703, partial [Abditibacteriota bacterium]|nr:hypothetical protein [Abditibacteriota bacterium]
MIPVAFGLLILRGLKQVAKLLAMTLTTPNPAIRVRMAPSPTGF